MLPHIRSEHTCICPWDLQLPACIMSASKPCLTCVLPIHHTHTLRWVGVNCPAAVLPPRRQYASLSLSHWPSFATLLPAYQSTSGLNAAMPNGPAALQQHGRVAWTWRTMSATPSGGEAGESPIYT